MSIKDWTIESRNNFYNNPIPHSPLLDHDRFSKIIYPTSTSVGVIKYTYGCDISLSSVASTFANHLVTNSKDIDGRIVDLVNKNFWNLLA